ncbi:histidine--tRNA ligase [Leptospira sp. 2 VSF19]|uniref:Histidine--tRNA ligase n=1 Tax=Leptospira soteropolitanensis TaxID=2950025 RepID=A0AAW5VIY6_9LEPT|nr:histidine--tRNA ligase [Leptospira soteropolitanensis]MCW7491316.1 histidine--tRNA ligase [Leptospira soteropolitanensis]MCW7498901.1 histidine--tRNA ligase [Leptospira soteropolitanensis]MCW7521507.1 histidine--tRNA ligase [Leptospira soteropolitanensis]MCW7525004.1 histidine--tRNA ligase [Leptospira soteropolitanensis]MCW7528872.1 histidine--tRNA ligase [Leptospira soteropolitanensis]
MKEQKLTTENYKGTRDFYPEDMRLRNYLFSVMKDVVRSYGYEEYDGPMVESLDLYRAKTGEEIVGKQIYNFIDKGDREVAIRPEMTPTVARMVAKKLRDLPRPIRWFSIPNLWRYEQPGHGRLREHWQLNVDMFGVTNQRAELEILSLACDILFAFGAPRNSFKVTISHRSLLDEFLLDGLKVSPNQAHEVSKILDKKNKITEEEYTNLVSKTIPNDPTAVSKINLFLAATTDTLDQIPGIKTETRSTIQTLFQDLKTIGLDDIVIFDPSVVRGFDYYTGFIFEIFDTSPQNKRSLYGGGRYDNLIGLFSNEELSGIGFGLGDVTLQNFLTVHNLLPKFANDSTVYIPLLDESTFAENHNFAKELRKEKISAEVSLVSQKMGKQLSYAEKKGYRWILLRGEDEIKAGTVTLKDMATRNQWTFSFAEALHKIKEELSK